MRASLLLPLALLALAGCRDQRQQLGQALSGKPPVIAGSLEGEWQSEDLNGGGPVAHSRLMFDPGDQGTSRLSGTAGCNRLMGGFQLNGEQLRFSRLASTQMACAPQVMGFERRVVQALAQVRRWSLDKSNLLLQDARGRTLLLFRSTP